MQFWHVKTQGSLSMAKNILFFKQTSLTDHTDGCYGNCKIDNKV